MYLRSKKVCFTFSFNCYFSVIFLQVDKGVLHVMLVRIDPVQRITRLYVLHTSNIGHIALVGCVI